MHGGALVYRHVLPGTPGQGGLSISKLEAVLVYNGCCVLSGETSAWMKSFA